MEHSGFIRPTTILKGRGWSAPGHLNKHEAHRRRHASNTLARGCQPTAGRIDRHHDHRATLLVGNEHPAAAGRDGEVARAGSQARGALHVPVERIGGTPRLIVGSWEIPKISGEQEQAPASRTIDPLSSRRQHRPQWCCRPRCPRHGWSRRRSGRRGSTVRVRSCPRPPPGLQLYPGVALIRCRFAGGIHRPERRSRHRWLPTSR
jgi:hypothetical protein